MSDEVETRVRAVLSEIFGMSPEQIGPETSTDTVEDWDSLQHLTIVLALEEEFGIHLTDDDVVAIVTFPLMVTVVREVLEGSEQTG